MKNNLALLIFIIFTFSSCLDEDRGTLKFIDKTRITTVAGVPSIAPEELQELQNDLWREKLLNEKEVDWKRITSQAQDSYKDIAGLVKRKCLDCHDSLTPLPFYGRIFPSRNPVNRHQVEGLESLDFAEVFPLKAKGSPPQLSLLKAIRTAVLEKSMPLKSYLLVYPLRRVRDKDQTEFLNWTDPLIEEIENFNEKYSILNRDQTNEEKVTRLFQAKCFRCHGNGNNRGGFAQMNDYQELFKNPKAIDLNNLENSAIYTLSVSGRMPTDKSERLTPSELALMLEWMQERKQ